MTPFGAINVVVMGEQGVVMEPKNARMHVIVAEEAGETVGRWKVRDLDKDSCGLIIAHTGDQVGTEISGTQEGGHHLSCYRTGSGSDREQSCGRW